MNNKDIYKFYSSKKILITGHTGFKGSWLSAWLSLLDAEVYGYSINIPTRPSHYNLINNKFKKEYFQDITDKKKLHFVLKKLKPDIIFHLAAQPLVITSYNKPYLTYNTNAIGTLNLLENLRVLNQKCNLILITTDKVYLNTNLSKKFVETDKLGGSDPYSGSKAASEIIISTYYNSFFKTKKSKIKLAVGRAGNVIGGGDWSKNRIVSDTIKSWSKKIKLDVRSPYSTRPWQHVLEPLSGYILLCFHLNKNANINGEAFNFGPMDKKDYTVGDLVNALSMRWPNSIWNYKKSSKSMIKESLLLSLNSSKAKKYLNWNNTLSFKKTAQWTGQWYDNYYNTNAESAMNTTFEQINKFMILSKNF